MILTIKEARELLGEKGSKYSDGDLEEIINLFSYLADLIIDQYLAQRAMDKEVEHLTITPET